MGGGAFEVMAAVDRYYNHDDLRASEEATMAKTAIVDEDADEYDNSVGRGGDFGADGLDIGMGLMTVLGVYVLCIQQRQQFYVDQEVYTRRIWAAVVLVVVVYGVFTLDPALRIAGAWTGDTVNAVVVAAVLFGYANAAGMRAAPPPALSQAGEY
jgi:hypothetical protein